MKITTVTGKLPAVVSIHKKMLRLAAAVIVLSLLNSCGGGISGSGDGETSKDYELIKPYHISNFPVGFAAAIPASLIDNQNTYSASFNESDPAFTVMSNIDKLVDRMLAIALAQLYLDANWNTVLEYCSHTSPLKPCSLSGSGIAATYTSAMALWEANFRSKVEQYHQWHTGQDASDDFRQLFTAANEKVGSLIPLDSVVLTESDPETDGYNYIVEIDIEIPERVTVTLRWNTDLQSGTFTTQDTLSGEPILLAGFSTVDGLMQHKFSLNKTSTIEEPGMVLYTQELPGTDNSFVVSNIKQITAEATTEIDSQGLAGEVEGYLRSEATIYNNQNSSVLSYRQSFNKETTDTASCNPAFSTSDCREDTDWTTLSGEDPALSGNFVSKDEIDSIKESYSIGVNTVHLYVSYNSAVSSYAIIDRAGVDADDFDDFLEDIEGVVDDDDLESESGLSEVTPEYDKRVLCRVTNSRSSDADFLEVVCDATADQLNDVFVVAEQIDDDDLELSLLQNQDFRIVIVD